MAVSRVANDYSSEELRRLSEQSDLLYDRYLQPLEAEHWGELVAVSPDGRMILGTDERELLLAAKAEFGPGNYLFRIGPRAISQWL